MKYEGYEGEYLSLEDIVTLHDKIIDQSAYNDDKGFIDGTSALFQNAYYGILSGFGGVEVYPTIVEKSCRLCYNIITSHVFCNANKRTGLMVLLQMLDLNGYTFSYTEEEMYDIVVRVASNSCSYEELVSFVNKRIQNLDAPKFG